MPKTKADIHALALSRIGVLAVGEVPSAAEYADAEAGLDMIADEMVTDQGLTLPDLDTTPDGLAGALAWVLAFDLAILYEIQPRLPRSRAVMRVRSYLLDDDRPDPADYDEDGTVSEAEADAYARAAYY